LLEATRDGGVIEGLTGSFLFKNSTDYEASFQTISNRGHVEAHYTITGNNLTTTLPSQININGFSGVTGENDATTGTSILWVTHAGVTI